MSVQKTIQKRQVRRTYRVRNRIRAASQRPRVSVYRSLKQIYAQIIDDSTGQTLASFSSLALKERKGDKKEVAKTVGLQLGKLAKDRSISAVVFDRGPYAYGGRIAALADGLRESGLNV